MTPSPPAPASTACRLSISRSLTSTRSSSSRSTKPWPAPRTPTNSSCAFRVFAPPPTPPAKRWPRKWPTSSASPGNKNNLARGLLFLCAAISVPVEEEHEKASLCPACAFGSDSPQQGRAEGHGHSQHRFQELLIRLGQ